MIIQLQPERYAGSTSASGKGAVAATNFLEDPSRKSSDTKSDFNLNGHLVASKQDQNAPVCITFGEIRRVVDNSYKGDK